MEDFEAELIIAATQAKVGGFEATYQALIEMLYELKASRALPLPKGQPKRQTNHTQ